ncbi:uncharacterized protein LOC143024578 [Oratosquilla oratoria]|uniref:uncharacterized protein LOC143024578 n=1 Tax=Oratosquilla oratoria TaxID=337810 RepID=UPI003F7654F3
MDEVLRCLYFCFINIDNVFIANPDADNHRQHLQQVFTRLQAYGIHINVDKSEHGVPSIEFLGHTITLQASPLLRPHPLYPLIYAWQKRNFNHTQLEHGNRRILRCSQGNTKKNVTTLGFPTHDWKQSAFFSKKHNNAEKKDSAFDKELLVIYKAVKRFRHFVKRREFHLYMNHKPITTTSAHNKTTYIPRQLRHIDFIFQFTTNIRFV